MARKISRRKFLEISATGAAGLVVAACTPAAQVGVTAVPTPAAPKVGVTAVPPTVVKPVQLKLDPRKYLMDPLVDPPKRYDGLVITQNKEMNQYIKFREGETIEDNVVYRYIKEIMGIDYKIVNACKGPETCPQAWATMLASGDIPDYLEFVAGTNLGQLMNGDRLQDLTDLFPKYASPLTLKKKEWGTSVMWKPLTRKGRIYGIAFPNMGVAFHESLLWVRQDWLDKLGLKMPQTLDEVYNVAKAFVKEKLAPMGISAAGQDGMVDWQSSLDPFFGAYGVMPTFWLKDGKGGLVYGSTLPENKKVLEVLRKWYGEKLIEAEFMTKGANKCSQNMASNSTGMFFGPGWSIGWPLVDSMKNDPKAVWSYGDIPTGPDGKRGRGANPKLAWFGSCFRKGVPEIKVEAVINHLNWIYAMLEASPMGKHMMFEGYDYAIKDGVAKDAGFTTYWAEGGPGYPTWFYPAMAQEENAKLDLLAKKDPKSLNPVEAMRLSDPTGVIGRAAYKRVAQTLEWAVIDEYMGPPTATQTEKGAFLTKLERERYTQIITGQIPVSDHDRFVSEWKANGGDQITKEVNEWYKSL